MKPFIAFSLVLLTTLDTRAQGLIWSADNHAGNNGVAPGQSWQIAFDHVPANVGYPPSLNPVSGIFSMSLGTNDAGRTFFANALNEPGFGGFVAGLTDGVNNYIRFQNGPPITFGLGLEQFYLGRSAAAPDLADYNITQIGFRVNNFYDYYNVQEESYFRQLDYSLDFYGAPVPEPGTWALLGLGSALLWSATRRRRK